MFPGTRNYTGLRITALQKLNFIEDIEMITKVIKSWWWVFVVFGYLVHPIRNNSQISLREAAIFLLDAVCLE